ncbi:MULTISPECIES: YafY family protein [unclassified Facklamia]|uniref:helix-turn-helix transcriptional regulator n=1 Tax=Aerococcaceae TaxID=186827 RepID=UPI0013B9F734|nr:MULTISPECIES: YafY family protein [unclassified Facklamia]MBS4462428.1 YafY family transcriptional regulator [Aerococcaceae bacterium zg-B36]NEW65015.1 WYL domain-containing protein [Facklamia sp. 252]NEW68596.1 WYL domain-containing protein [Facklamia sp. 253]QQD65082.1 YafY family transcriptional regulator [Aerococcaceae bacterium zg-252]
MKNNRLFKILYYVLEKGKVTANELAEKYEVSIRTIYRDIDVLSSAGISIYATKGKGGGIEIADDFVLKKSFLSKNEQEQILIALKGLELTNKEYENELLIKLTALFKTKNTNWIEVDFTNWQRSKSFDELFKDIKSAIINKNIVRFIYFSSNKKETSRKVKPIRLLFKGWDWYVYAFCLSRNDFRYFKLSRIKEFEILPNTFEDDFDSIVLKKEMEYEETVFVKVKFDRKMAFRVFDEVSSAIEEDEDGNLYATVELPNDYNLYNYIFSYGDAAEVLEPKEIRDKIKNIINIMAKKYRI